MNKVGVERLAHASERAQDGQPEMPASPAAQYAVGVGLPSVGAGGVAYLATGSMSHAVQAGGTALTVGALGQVRAGRGASAAEERAFQAGVSSRRTVGSWASTARSYAAAAGFGLYSSSSTFSLGESGSSYSLSNPQVSGYAAPPASIRELAPAQPVQAPVQQAPVQQAPVQQAPAQPVSVQVAAEQSSIHATAVLPAGSQQTIRTAADETRVAGVITSMAPSRPWRSAAIAASEASMIPVDAIVGSHSSSPRVRAEVGVSGAMFESAHILAQSVGAAINRVLPGRYSAGRALAVLLPPTVHRAFDQGWIHLWNQRVASNQRTTVVDARDLLRAAIDNIPANLLTSGEKGALMTVLDHQLFQVLGLDPDLVLFGGP